MNPVFLENSEWLIQPEALHSMVLASRAFLDRGATLPQPRQSNPLLSVEDGRDRVRFQYVNATSDKAASLLIFKAPSASMVVTATSAANQAVVNCVPYTGAAANDVVVLFS